MCTSPITEPLVQGEFLPSQLSEGLQLFAPIADDLEEACQVGFELIELISSPKREESDKLLCPCRQNGSCVLRRDVSGFH